MVMFDFLTSNVHFLFKKQQFFGVILMQNDAHPVFQIQQCFLPGHFAYHSVCDMGIRVLFTSAPSPKTCDATL
jgi:hypothetical protein